MLKTISLLVSFFLVSVSFAQPTLQQKLQTDLDINTQFQTLLLQSRNQDADFKIIRKSNIEIIQKNVQDSLSKYKNELAKITEQSSSSTTTITSLQDSVQALANELTAEKAKTDNISLLGISLDKTTYHVTVWSIIAVLFILAFILLASFRKAKASTVEHQQSTEEAQNELHAVKKKAMEKEQQLKRQLLDEQLKRNS